MGYMKCCVNGLSEVTVRIIPNIVRTNFTVFQMLNIN